MIALLAAAIAAAPVPAPPLASLQVATDGSAMIVEIRDNNAAGRTLEIDCVDRCPGPPHFAERFDDTPLGLFQPFDREPIVVAVAAGGSVYRVRAYRVTSRRITRVLDAATRAAPGFAVSENGAIVVTTTERRGGNAGPGDDRRVTWTWRGGRFDRSEAASVKNPRPKSR